jgi:hypothetical protein
MYMNTSTKLFTKVSNIISSQADSIFAPVPQVRAEYTWNNHT